MTAESQICKDCSRDLPLSEFWFVRSGRYAGRPFDRCKNCTKARRKVECGKRTPEQRAEYRRRKGPVTKPYVPKSESATIAKRRKEQIAACKAAARFFQSLRPRQRKPSIGTHAWYQVASQDEIAAHRVRKRDEQREKRRSNPDYDRQKAKRYKRDNPSVVARQRAERRSQLDRADDGTLTNEVVKALYRDATHCPYCCAPLTQETKSLDHVVPLSRGGLHSVKNVIVCCRPCNSSKHVRSPEEWTRAAA